MTVKKIMLTQEQAKAIEKLREHHRSEMEKFKKEPDIFAEWLKPLHELSVDEIDGACYEGYKVEPEFNYGDWVVHECRYVSKVEIIEHRLIITDHPLGYKREDGSDVFLNSVPELFRHATLEEIAKEKQRRWWSEHYRDVGELSRGDILTDKRGSGSNAVYVVTKVHSDGSVTLDARDNWAVDELLEQCYVVCFGEDRKDIKS